MTKRRLINKKAYDELVLLFNFCKTNKKDGFKYVPTLTLDKEYNEKFVIMIFDKSDFVINILDGKDYTEVSKKLMEYLSNE